MIKTFALVTLALTMPSATIAGGTCRMDHADYLDKTGLAHLTFEPASNDETTNAFHLTIDKQTLDGDVVWSDDVRRPNGNLYFKCPDGDLSDDQLDACTIWQDVIYAVTKDGFVSLLPGEKADPPPTLILSDLGWSIHDSKAFGKGGIRHAPDDIFHLSGCSK